MAWISVKRQGQFCTSDDAGATKTATEVYIAIADSPTTPVAAETATDGVTSIPAFDAAHPHDANRRRTTLAVKSDETRTSFTVEVKFSTRAGAALIPNPLDRDPEISWGFNDYTETYAIDRTPEDDDGPLPVLNTAKQLFEEFLERDTGSLTCTIRKNIPADAYDPAVAVAFKDVVNEDAFDLDGKTIAAGQCKMKSYTVGPRLMENGIAYRVAEWVLEFKETWDHEVESRGYQELVSGDPMNWEDITGADGKRVDSPWPLDEEGIALGGPDWDPATLTFKPYFTDEFAPFEALWAYAA